MSREVERRLLQVLVGISCLSPLGFGMIGMVRGADGFGGGIGGADSHFRYLSGIFFGVGVMALSTVPHIERMTERFGWRATWPLARPAKLSSTRSTWS